MSDDAMARAAGAFSKTEPLGQISIVDVVRALLISLVPILWLIVTPGWPMNHEGLRAFRRIGIFGGQWRLGHLVPVWSTTALHGYGSASPIIYHKVFNVVSTTVWLCTGAPKTAVLGGILLGMVVLCLGAGRACRILVGRRDATLETATAVMVAFATYTTTDWLTRGAMAEFYAMSAVVWLFGWCLLLLRRGIFSGWLGPLMAAICLCHAAIGLFCVIPVAVCIAIALIRWPANWRTWLRAGGSSVAATGVLLAPVLAANRAYAAYSSIDILGRGMAAGGNDAAFHRLFFEPVWHWGDAPFALTMQIDPLLLTVGVLAAVLAVIRSRRRLEVIFLLAVTAIMMGLQSRYAQPLYNAVPVMLWLQFTFRLLTFVTVALALCGTFVLDEIGLMKSPPVAVATTTVLVILMSLGKPWLGYHPETLLYSDDQVRQALNDETFATESWEYYPRGTKDDLHARAKGQFIAPDDACLGRPMDDMTRERGKARFAVSCGKQGTTILPINLAPGMRFRLKDGPAEAFRACWDARARLQVTSDTVVTVIYPGFWRAVFDRPDDPALSCASARINIPSG